VYYCFLDRPQFALMKLHNIRAVFFNRGSAEPLCSTSGCQGFRRNRLKLPGANFTTPVLCGCSNTDTWIIVLGSMINANIHIWFRCSKMDEKHCIRVLLNRANWWNYQTDQRNLDITVSATSNRLFFYDLLIIFVKGKADHNY